MSVIGTIKDYFYPKVEPVTAKEEAILKPPWNMCLDETYGEVEYALKKGFDVKFISGEPSSTEEKKRLANLLELYPNNFHLYALPTPPKDHFQIIGDNLYIEVPHKPDAKVIEALGITKAHNHILKAFYKKFEDSLKYAREITRKELVYT